MASGESEGAGETPALPGSCSAGILEALLVLPGRVSELSALGPAALRRGLGRDGGQTLHAQPTASRVVPDPVPCHLAVHSSPRMKRFPASARLRARSEPPARNLFGRFLLALWVLVALPERTAEAAATATAESLPPYGAWRDACRRLPTNRELGTRLAPRDRLPLRSFAEFAAVLDPFLELSRTGALAQASAWLDAPPPADPFLNLESGYFLSPSTPFLPFAQRHVVPPGTRAFFHGDLHGDIHSLLGYLDSLNRDGVLDGFRVTRPEFRVVFLGDYTDRGRHGVEVLYTLLRLKLANPDQVLLVRGNHEDYRLVSQYGFLQEAMAKYRDDFDVRRVVRLYDFLPAVLYFGTGTNLIQCNHGGLEPGFNPGRLLGASPGTAYQLLGRLEQRRLLKENPSWIGELAPAERRALEANLVDFVPTSPTTPTVLGFMWNDFTVALGEPQFAVDAGRAFVYGDRAARQSLADSSRSGYRVRALFRAHQHSGVLNPMMRRLIASRGLFRHWQGTDSHARLDADPALLQATLDIAEERRIPDGSVWTFNVSPDSVYGAGCGFTFDTAGEVTTAERWEDWRLKVRVTGK